MERRGPALADVCCILLSKLYAERCHSHIYRTVSIEQNIMADTHERVEIRTG